MLHSLPPPSLNLRFSVSTIMFVILVSLFIVLPATAEFPPSWLKQGTYVRYDDPSGCGDGITLQMNMFYYNSFRWECLSLEGNSAVLNVSIIYEQTIRFSTLVNVNVENRNVTFPNGTYIGKTWLWLPANPSPDETIEVTDGWIGKPEAGMLVATCQGTQKGYAAGDVAYTGGFYDFDTGLAVQPSTWDEPTLLAMSVRRLGNLVIADTNVDLGPREWWIDVVNSLPIVAPVAGFVGVFAFIWHRRQQKKKQMEALLKKQRKKNEN